MICSNIVQIKYNIYTYKTYSVYIYYIMYIILIFTFINLTDRMLIRLQMREHSTFCCKQ